MRHNPGYGIMGQLVQQRGIPTFGRGAGLRANEAMTIRHRDAVGCAIVECTLTGNGDVCARGCDECFGSNAWIDAINGRFDCRKLETIDLCDVEHARCAGNEETISAIIVIAG